MENIYSFISAITFSDIARTATVINLILTAILFYKLRVSYKNIDYHKNLLKAGTTDNSYYHAGLNMGVDVNATPLEILNNIKVEFDHYKKIAKAMDKYISGHDNTALWEFRVIGLNNWSRKMDLHINQLEIAILELEFLNKKVPLPADLHKIEVKRQELIDKVKNTSYID